MTSHGRTRPNIRAAEIPQRRATDGEPEATEHTHPVPRLLAWSVAATAVLLLTGVLLLAAYAYSITARLTAVETYIAERGQVRDEQAADIREQLRQAVCDVLDRLPPDAPALNPLRAEYGCGPGTPPEDLP